MPTRMLSCFTADELLRQSNDDQRYELVAGELTRMSPAGGEHGSLAAAVAEHLRRHVRACRAGTVFGAETGFLLQRDPDTVLAPDAAFVRRDRLDPAHLPRGYPELAPDLVVEIRSPSQSLADLQHKLRAWLQAGCQLGWLIDPDSRRVFVHTPERVRLVAADESLDGGVVLPGFVLPLRELFAQ